MSQERLEAETAAEPLLEALIAELDSTAATVAERRRLAHLLSANRYRLPELSFSQQNRYHGAIQRRLFQVDRQLALSKCADINARMGLTGRMAAYEIVDQLGTSMGDVVCQSAVATGRGEFRPLGPAQNGIYTVRSGGTTLVFRLGRYVRTSQAFFPSGSPAQLGEPAFRFDGVRVAGRTQPAPRGFLVNFLAQFAGPWTEFSRDLR